MDRKKALINISVSVVFRIFILVVSLFSRRYLINALGNEANGLYSLYLSILGFLAIAELGVGTAISFSMYKPMVEGDNNTVSALYYLYKRIYRIITIVILVTGLILIPLLPLFAKDATGGFDIYTNYTIVLISTLITYLYASETSFINATKDNYVTNIIRSSFLILEAVFQVILLLTMPSLEGFLLVIFVSNILQYIITKIVFFKNYKNRINGFKEISESLKKDVTKKTKAMFMHKIGGVLVISLSGVIISTFVSVILLGKYNNYLLIINGMNGLIALVFTSMTSIIGHYYSKGDTEKFYVLFKKVYFLNYLLAVIFYLGFFSISNNLISLLFGGEQVLSQTIVFLITISFFIRFLRQSTMLFKDATGAFYYDRFKPLIEGFVNLLLSIILVNFFGIIGVLIANIVTDLVVCHVIEPYVTFKYSLKKRANKFYLFNYTGIVLFVVLLVITKKFIFSGTSNSLKFLFIDGSLSVLISVVFIGAILIVIKLYNITINKIKNNRKPK